MLSQKWCWLSSRHLEDGTGEPGLRETVRDDGDSGEDGRWWVMLPVPLSEAGRWPPAPRLPGRLSPSTPSPRLAGRPIPIEPAVLGLEKPIELPEPRSITDSPS